MKEENKERIEKEGIKLYPTSAVSRMYFMNGAYTEHDTAFNQGKIEGFNEGIEAALKCFVPMYSIGPTKITNLLKIIEELQSAIINIEKLKKPN